MIRGLAMLAVLALVLRWLWRELTTNLDPEDDSDWRDWV